MARSTKGSHWLRPGSPGKGRCRGVCTTEVARSQFLGKHCTCTEPLRIKQSSSCKYCTSDQLAVTHVTAGGSEPPVVLAQPSHRQHRLGYKMSSETAMQVTVVVQAGSNVLNYTSIMWTPTETLLLLKKQPEVQAHGLRLSQGSCQTASIYAVAVAPGHFCKAMRPF